MANADNQTMIQAIMQSESGNWLIGKVALSFSMKHFPAVKYDSSAIKWLACPFLRWSNQSTEFDATVIMKRMRSHNANISERQEGKLENKFYINVKVIAKETFCVFKCASICLCVSFIEMLTLNIRCEATLHSLTRLCYSEQMFSYVS